MNRSALARNPPAIPSTLRPCVLRKVRFSSSRMERINTTGAQVDWAPAWRVGGIAPGRRLFLCRVGRCRVHIDFDVVSFQLGVCTGKRFSCMLVMLTLRCRYFVLTFFLFGFKTIPTIEETNEIPPQEINHAAVVWQAIPSLLHTPSAPGNCVTMKANAREITATAKSMSFFANESAEHMAMSVASTIPTFAA